ncbi:HlyD family efflux transporter periplasmic adaptor subunit [Lagierella sp.]|uniref:HlyD family efflux transporter periplasmic adaptor subunit n=1 Tax=Lagierella sp. TaxID=2849657 RepID=UPI0026382518|nr:HlyD family efflux transporter periplasmic adaptor subunit [Lagierella sp.]
MKKKRKKGIKISPQLIIVFLIIILISRNFYVKAFKGKTIDIDNIHNYENTISVTGLVIREEFLISYNEFINKEQENDSKISANSNIGSINSFQNNLDLDLDEAKKKFDELNNEENVYMKKKKSEDNKAEEEKEEPVILMNEDVIYKKIRNSEFNEIYKLDETSGQYLSDNREELNYLKNKYRVISNVLENNGENMKSPVPGIISENLDGYEDILNPYNIDLEDFDFDLEKTTQEPKESVGTKIVNNNFFYLYLKIPTSKLLKEYDIGSSIKVKIDKTYLTGEIEDKFEDEEFTKLLLYFNSGFKNVEKTRFIKTQLINYEKKSFILPNSAIVKKKNLWGVYTKTASGIVEFKPVEIIKEDDNETYVSIGDNSKISLGGKKHSTIMLYDEVILHPNLVKDNELLE